MAENYSHDVSIKANYISKLYSGSQREDWYKKRNKPFRSFYLTVCYCSMTVGFLTPAEADEADHSLEWAQAYLRNPFSEKTKHSLSHFYTLAVLFRGKNYLCKGLGYRQAYCWWHCLLLHPDGEICTWLMSS